MPANPDQICPACGGELRKWRSVPSFEPAVGPARYELARCLRCGTARTLGEVPPALHDSGAYGPATPRFYRVVRPLLDAFDRQRLGLLGELVTPGASLRDVGAGRGRFVANARRAGYDAAGIEPSRRGAEAAAALGVPVEHASIGSAAVASGSLAAVTLWHVLEHVEDPGAALHRIGSWLQPGGALLVGVPNLGSLQSRLGGERWYHLDVPRHRTHFTLGGLDALLGTHGFATVRVHHGLLEHNPFGMWQSLVNRVTSQPSYLYNLLKRNAPWRTRDLPVTLAAVPLAPVAALLEWLAARSGHGGTVAVLAVRGQ